MLEQTTVVGAGPYGLAVAAHLRGAGAPAHVIGRAMSFWDEQMPRGMLLRSPYAASSIGSPDGHLSLDAFAATTGVDVGSPVPLDRFVEYGRWVQSQVAPDLDERTVQEVARDGSGFRIVYEDGEERATPRVVLAAGIHRFADVPEVFRALPPSLVSHTADHRDLSRFAGDEVLVVGRGQSALESAALLHEAGAVVQIVTRSDDIRWLGQRPWLRSLGPVSSLIYSPAEVGPPLLCRLVDQPQVVRRLPAGARTRLHDRSVRPAGARWLHDRIVGPVPIRLGRHVVATHEKEGRAVAELDDGTRIEADHVLLGTGYRIDLPRYGLLSPELLGRVRLAQGHPVLRRGHETSVEGLHVVGAPAVWSYGPIMRFVAGSQAAAVDVALSGGAFPAAAMTDVAAHPGAIVLGADYRGLGVVRSLGRRGIPVVVLRDDEDHGSVPSSWYCTETLRWPSSDEGRDELLAELAERSASTRWALFPTGDETAAYVARRHEALAAHFVLTTPDWETFRWAYDKRLTYRLAGCVSVEHPRTSTLEDRRDAAAHDGPFPVLLKPAMKPRRSRLADDKAWVVSSTAELLARFDEAVALGDGDILMLQELVPRGEQVSFAALWRDGDPVVSVCARRARQYPLDIGRSSTYVESIRDDELEGLATRLAARLRLSGMAEMEFVRTPDGRCSLLDLNARVWGWHTICRDDGLDFPYLTWLQSTGHEIPRMHAGPGRRWRRLITDLPAAGAALARRRTTVGPCVASLVAPHERAVFALDDPLPGLLELPAFLWSRRRQGPDPRSVPSDGCPGSVAGCAP